MSRLRILRVIHTLRRESGGPSESVARSSQALLKLGHAVEVATMDREVAATGEKQAEGFPVHHPEASGGPGLVAWLKAEHGRFDAVLVHGLWQVGWPVSSALRGTGTPYLVFPHGMLDPWFRKAYPLKHVKKQVYWWLREGRVLREAAAVCFTCEEERRLARRTFFPYRVNERVVAYGTARPTGDSEGQRGEFARAVPDLAGRAFWLFLGRIHDKKGLGELIEAYAQLVRSARGEDAVPALVIAGPGLETDYGRRMQKLAADKCPPGAVLWPGMLAGEVKWGALHACEAFVLPSHQENFGIAVAEALACAKPVLISDKVNIWREITGDGAGIVGPDTVEGTLEVLRTWVALDEARRREMSAAALVCFETRFEISRAAESLAEAVKAAAPRR